MSLWVVRAGVGTGAEQECLENSFVGIGWAELGDLRGLTTRDEIRSRMDSSYPDAKPKARIQFTGQVLKFRSTIQRGDIVALPLRSRPAIAFGRVTGDYEYVPGANEFVRHQRQVEWIRDDVPRAAFDQDLLYMFGAFSTVFGVKRNDAERRVLAVLSGSEVDSAPIIDIDDDSGEVAGIEDLALYARDQIREHIYEHYKEHDLADLVAAILKAQGYTVFVSPPGQDGGVDVLAGSGLGGFSEPRIAVQVKSGLTVTSTPLLNQLLGAGKDSFEATHYLFVSWAGFTRDAEREAKRKFFRLRLWDSDDLINNLIESYAKLPDQVKARIPIVRAPMLLAKGSGAPTVETT